MPLQPAEFRARAQTFAARWMDARDEASEAKPFWLDFFEIFGITDKRVGTFEQHVKKRNQQDGYIDLLYPGKLLVEHKSRGKDLDAAMQQAYGYVHGLPEEDLPELMVVCDFAHWVVRHVASNSEHRFALRQLHKHIMLFGTLAGYKPLHTKPDNPVNIRAAQRMGQLHDALQQCGHSGHPLEVLLVRLLFCLFADDTGIFFPAQSFGQFISEHTGEDGSDMGPRLAQLFQVLNTPVPQRSPLLDENLAAA